MRSSPEPSSSSFAAAADVFFGCGGGCRSSPSTISKSEPDSALGGGGGLVAGAVGRFFGGRGGVLSLLSKLISSADRLALGLVHDVAAAGAAMGLRALARAAFLGGIKDFSRSVSPA